MFCSEPQDIDAPPTRIYDFLNNQSKTLHNPCPIACGLLPLSSALLPVTSAAESHRLWPKRPTRELPSSQSLGGPVHNLSEACHHFPLQLQTSASLERKRSAGVRGALATTTLHPSPCLRHSLDVRGHESVPSSPDMTTHGKPLPPTINAYSYLKRTTKGGLRTAKKKMKKTKSFYYDAPSPGTTNQGASTTRALIEKKNERPARLRSKTRQ